MIPTVPGLSIAIVLDIAGPRPDLGFEVRSAGASRASVRRRAPSDRSRAWTSVAAVEAATPSVSCAALAASSAPLAICSIERRSCSAADAASVIPAESSSVAAAIRSSIFCWRAPEMLPGAGLRRGAGTEAEPGAGCALERRSAVRPAPSAEVFIRDFGPLAASVLKGGAAATGGIQGGCRRLSSGARSPGLWHGPLSHAGLFPHSKIRIPKVVSLVGGGSHWLKLRGLRKPIQAKQGSHRASLVSNWRDPTTVITPRPTSSSRHSKPEPDRFLTETRSAMTSNRLCP